MVYFSILLGTRPIGCFKYLDRAKDLNFFLRVSMIMSVAADTPSHSLFLVLSAPSPLILPSLFLSTPLHLSQCQPFSLPLSPHFSIMFYLTLPSSLHPTFPPRAATDPPAMPEMLSPAGFRFSRFSNLTRPILIWYSFVP